MTTHSLLIDIQTNIILQLENYTTCEQTGWYNAAFIATVPI